MERLTMDNGLCQAVNTEFCISQEDCCSCPHGQKSFKRLAAYEDAMPLERAQELARVEKDGRLVVLPCKVGDTVWTNIAIVGDRYKSADRPYPTEIVFIGIGGNGGFFHVQYSNGRIFPFDFDKFGKTVFLTREEAEAARKLKLDDSSI